jgi:hypothetical protein
VRGRSFGHGASSLALFVSTLLRRRVGKGAVIVSQRGKTFRTPCPRGKPQ